LKDVTEIQGPPCRSRGAQECKMVRLSPACRSTSPGGGSPAPARPTPAGRSLPAQA
jgi:hypothetical protein